MGLGEIINDAVTNRCWGGKSLEDFIETELKKKKYRCLSSEMFKQNEYYKNIKNMVLNEQNEYLFMDCDFDKRFIFQPFGTQSFPDFLIFNEKRIIPLEVKFCKANVPLWNNSLPRQSGFYLLNLNNTKVFFKGSDVITPLLETILKDIGYKCQELATLLNEESVKYDNKNYGWKTYIRINFFQTSGGSFIKNENTEINYKRAISDIDIVEI